MSLQPHVAYLVPEETARVARACAAAGAAVLAAPLDLQVCQQHPLMVQFHGRWSPAHPPAVDQVVQAMYRALVYPSGAMPLGPLRSRARKCWIRARKRTGANGIGHAAHHGSPRAWALTTFSA